MNKQEFRDALYLRYSITLPKLPSTCVCGAAFGVDHALNCARGGFIIIRHNEIRDLTSDLLNTVCNDVQVEPMLQPLTGERFKLRTANVEEGARLDVSARGFWMRGNKAFVDVKVFNPLGKANMSKPLKSAYRANEAMKKRSYNERILQIEHGTLMPLIFSSFGGAGFEADRFLKKLNEKLAEKLDESLSIVTNYTRIKYSFALLRTTLLCIRGSRSHKLSANMKEIDVSLAVSESRCV